VVVLSGWTRQVGAFVRSRPDVVILPGVLLFDVVLFSGFLEPDGRSTTTAGQVLVVGYELLAVGALGRRARYPVAVFVFCCLHAAAGAVLIGEITPVMAVLVALTAVAGRRSLLVSLAAALAATGVFALVVRAAVAMARPGAATSGFVAGSMIGYTVVVLVAWVIGRWLGRTSRRVRELESRRALAVADERARIARELHDIVSSTVTAMSLHAAGARQLVHTDPERVGAALSTIEEAGGHAVAELRRMLGLLRDTGSETGSGIGSETGSGIGMAVRNGRLAELDDLAARSAVLGVRAVVTRTGTPLALDASVDLAAHRIVQEALTNALRHGGPGTSATVRVDWSADRLHLRIDDDGAGRPVRAARDLSTGHGLLGLAERVAVVGGTLVHGRAGAGYRVEAVLPAAPAVPASPAVVASPAVRA
jgi:signal transduction histidine kinase